MMTSESLFKQMIWLFIATAENLFEPQQFNRMSIDLIEIDC